MIFSKFPALQMRRNEDGEKHNPSLFRRYARRKELSSFLSLLPPQSVIAKSKATKQSGAVASSPDCFVPRR